MPNPIKDVSRPFANECMQGAKNAAVLAQGIAPAYAAMVDHMCANSVGSPDAIYR